MRRRRSQPLDVGVERDHRERGAGVAIDDRDGVGVGLRAGRGTELGRLPAHRDGDEVGADRVRIGSGYLDVHCLTAISGTCTVPLRWPRTLNSKEGEPMTWSKPKFEFIEMCSEVTSYLYHR